MSKKKKEQTEDVSDLYKSSKRKGKKRRAKKRHNEKRFIKEVHELQDEGYDIDFIDNFEKW